MVLNDELDRKVHHYIVVVMQVEDGTNAGAAGEPVDDRLSILLSKYQREPSAVRSTFSDLSFLPSRELIIDNMPWIISLSVTVSVSRCFC